MTTQKSIQRAGWKKQSICVWDETAEQFAARNPNVRVVASNPRSLTSDAFHVGENGLLEHSVVEKHFLEVTFLVKPDSFFQFDGNLFFMAFRPKDKWSKHHWLSGRELFKNTLSNDLRNSKGARVVERNSGWFFLAPKKLRKRFGIKREVLIEIVSGKVFENFSGILQQLPEPFQSHFRLCA